MSDRQHSMTPRQEPVTVRWRATAATQAEAAATASPILVAMLRGLRDRCPVCGKGPVFRGYLRVVETCAVCGTRLGSVRADDAPPYFTIFIVGHVIVLSMLWVENRWQPPLWLHAAIWLPLTAVLSLALLRPVKGATVGLLVRLNLQKRADNV